MSDNSYCAYRDGKFVEVPKIEDLCLALKDKFMRQEERNQYLSEENKKLKEGIWEKEETARLKAEYEKMKHEYYHLGFPITEEEKEKIDEWSKTHECTTRGTRAQGYRTFLFSPTELGIVGKVKCSCGKTFIFRELS